MAQKIEVGQIWQVTSENFLTSGIGSNSKEKTGGRQIKIKKGEMIEIRYPFCWHFRTIDNFYFHAEPEMIYENAKLFGVIWEKIRWKNTASLKDIINLELFDKEK